MTAATRAIAVIVGVAAVVVALAALVREAALAVTTNLSWAPNGRLTELTSDPSWVTGVVAAALGAAGVVLVLLAVFEFEEAGRGPLVIEFASASGKARLDVASLARGVRAHIERELPGVRTRALVFGKTDEGWIGRLEADVPARNLRATQARAERIAASDLAGTGGLRLTRLDLIVRGFTGAAATLGEQ